MPQPIDEPPGISAVIGVPSACLLLGTRMSGTEAVVPASSVAGPRKVSGAPQAHVASAISANPVCGLEPFLAFLVGTRGKRGFVRFFGDER